MDDALKKMREQSAGIELDEELAAQFPVEKQYELAVPGEEGDIRVHMYEPIGRKAGGPLIVNMHGGGFVKGYRGRDVVFSRNLACHTGCLVADVDYQIAPEKKYPYAMMEGYEVVKYFYERAEEFGICQNKIILSGQSAGANLITGIALLAKEKQEFVIAGLILAYPPLDLVTDPVEKPFSDTKEGRERAEAGRLYNQWYIDPERAGEIYASPVLGEKSRFSGLPPFMILSAEFDPLGEEAERFAWKLIQAGVIVMAKRFLGAKHGFLVRRNAGFLEAERMIFDMVEHIKQQ